MQNNDKSYYKTFLNFAIFSLIVGVLLWFYSPFANLNWGHWKVPKFNNFYQVASSVFATIAIFMFQRELKLAKSQQLNKDYLLMISYLEIRIKDLTKKCGLAEEKTNTLLARLKYLSQLSSIPDLALYLIEKILTTVEHFKADLNIHVSGNLETLSKIQVEDLKQSIDMILTPINNNFNNIDVDQRRDINLFIREDDNKVSLKVMHDYVGNPINTKMVKWNIKKLLHKYGANFIVENEREEESDLFVLCFTIEIPKGNKAKKIG